MNTEEELSELLGKACLGVGAVPDYQCLMIFFAGATLAVKFEGGVMTWEVMKDTIH